MSVPDAIVAEAAFTVPSAWADRGGWPVLTFEPGRVALSIRGVAREGFAWRPVERVMPRQPYALLEGRLWHPVRIGPPQDATHSRTWLKLDAALRELSTTMRWPGHLGLEGAPLAARLPSTVTALGGDARLGMYGRRRLGRLDGAIADHVRDHLGGWLAHDGRNLYARVSRPSLDGGGEAIFRSRPTLSSIGRMPQGSPERLDAYLAFLAACGPEPDEMGLRREAGWLLDETKGVEADDGELWAFANGFAGQVLSAINASRPLARSTEPGFGRLQRAALDLWPDTALGGAGAIPRRDWIRAVQVAGRAARTLLDEPHPLFIGKRMAMLLSYAELYALPAMAGFDAAAPEEDLVALTSLVD